MKPKDTKRAIEQLIGDIQLWYRWYGFLFQIKVMLGREIK